MSTTSATSENPFYSGWRLVDREALISHLSGRGLPPHFDHVDCDHVTFRYPSSEPPPEVCAVVIGWALGEYVEALVVEVNGSTLRPDGNTYHITYSYAPGHLPSESNELLRRGGWKEIEPSYPVAVIAFYERDPVVY